jgi:hypothetical protein
MGGKMKSGIPLLAFFHEWADGPSQRRDKHFHTP